jgi:hypothetical protein
MRLLKLHRLYIGGFYGKMVMSVRISMNIVVDYFKAVSTKAQSG